MDALQERRAALTLHVNDSPRLTKRNTELRAATDGGALVDPLWVSVMTLVGSIKAEHDRILAGDVFAGPDVLVTLPKDSTREQINEAFKLLRAQGWEIWPGALYRQDVFYFGRSQ